MTTLDPHERGQRHWQASLQLLFVHILAYFFTYPNTCFPAVLVDTLRGWVHVFF